MFEDITDSAQELLNKLGKVGSEEFKLQARIKQLEDAIIEAKRYITLNSVPYEILEKALDGK